MGIRGRLVGTMTLMVVLMVVMAGSGLDGIQALGQTLNRSKQDSQEVHQASRAAGDAAQALKTGVQEWKNVLIRGHTPADRTRFRTAMEKSLGEVRTHLTTLRGLAKQVDLDPALVDRVEQGLDQLLRGYTGAVEAWKEGDDLAYRAVDAAVKGMDRPVSQAMKDLLDRLETTLNEDQARARAESEGAQQAARERLLMSGAAALLAALVLGTALTISLRRPLERLRRSLVGLAAHDYRTAIPDLARGDEIGQMAQAVEILRRGLEAEHEVTVALQGRIAELTRAAEALARTGGTLEQVAGTSSTRAANVVQASRETSESISSAAAAAEEMSASIQEISGNSEKAVGIVTQAMTNAREASAAMEELGRANEAINQVAKAIADIAARTNLLALNASIEAASAGEAGRGFAVVAGEVKALALQTATSTQDISNRIEGVRRSVVQVEGAIARMTTAIDGIHGLQQGIAGSLQAQSAVTSDIGHTIITVSTRAQAIADAITEVSASAGTTEEQARITTAAAADLTRLAGEFTALARRLERTAT